MQLLQRAKIRWSGVALDRPDLAESSHSLAITFESLRGRYSIHAIFNAYWEPLVFELPRPSVPGQAWRTCIDTALPSPDDIRPFAQAPACNASSYAVQPRSVVLLAMNVHVPE
jgi:glycogen operon protein